MITGKANDPVTRGEFYTGMNTVLAFLFAVHFTAAQGAVLWGIVLFFLAGAIWVYAIAAWRVRRRSRAS